MQGRAHGGRPEWMAVAVLSMVGCATGCAPSESTHSTDLPSPADARSAGAAPIEPPESLDAMRDAQAVPITASQTAGAFSLGSTATGVQREALERQLTGAIVEWELRVYDVSLEEHGRFKVVSEPIAGDDAEAVEMMRVVALVTPRQAGDEALLRSVKTHDHLRIRGRVQRVVLRTIIAIDPAIVIDSPRAGPGDAH